MSSEEHKEYSVWTFARYFLVLFLVVLLAAFFAWLIVETVSRPDDKFIVGQFLLDVSPYTWASLGVTIGFSLSIIGAAW